MTRTARSPTEPNDYEKYRKPIQEIITFTDTIDAQYREKCFEILLNNYLLSGFSITTSCATEAPKSEKLVNESLSSDTRLFLQQNNISEEMLQKLFVKEKGLVQPIYRITETRRPKAQIQLALLAALENALRMPNGNFEFEVNTVRQRCMDLKIYDGRDFFINFTDSAGLFETLNNYQVIKLSPIGKGELAKIVTALSK